MNTKSKICITVLLSIILILIIINTSTTLKLNKQTEASELLRLEVDNSMITKDELIDYTVHISDIIKAHQEFSNIIADSIAMYKFPVLIYGYPENECGMCINKDLKQLYNFQKTIGKEHICILSIFSKNRNNKNRLKNELQSFNHKNIPQLKYITHRYYALIDSNGSVEMIFLPQLDRTNLSSTYFETIKSYFHIE